MQSAHANAVLSEWDELKNYDWRQVYNNMLKPTLVFDVRINIKKLEHVGFKKHSIRK
jgi:UDPglucose 6-dehydrogenase